MRLHNVVLWEPDSIEFTWLPRVKYLFKLKFLNALVIDSKNVSGRWIMNNKMDGRSIVDVKKQLRLSNTHYNIILQN